MLVHPPFHSIDHPYLSPFSEEQELSTPQKLTLCDPPVPLRVGRPRTTRLAARCEGKSHKANGGGGQHYRSPPPKPTRLPAREPLGVLKRSETESGSLTDRRRQHLVSSQPSSVPQSQSFTQPSAATPSRIDFIPPHQSSARKRPCCRICGHPGHN